MDNKESFKMDNTSTTRPKSARPSVTDSQKPDNFDAEKRERETAELLVLSMQKNSGVAASSDSIRIPKKVYLLVRGMNGDLIPVYLDDVIAEMAKEFPAKAKQFLKHLKVHAAMEPLSEALHADKKREQLNRELNTDGQGLASTREIMKKFDVRVPVQLLEILKPDEDGKLCAVQKNELLKTCFSIFVSDGAEDGGDDEVKYRLLVFDENDDDKVREIREVCEKEIHNYATDFLVTSDRELVAKNDTELASEYLDNGLGRVYSHKCYLNGDYKIKPWHSPLEQDRIRDRRLSVQDRRLFILYHVVDARIFLAEVRKEGLSRLFSDVRYWPASRPRFFSELRIPALEGCLEEMNYLLDFSEDVNAKCNEYSCTALHLAATEGHVEVVTALLDAKADIHVVDNSGGESTALHCAASHGEHKVVKCLLDAGANANASSNGCTALHIAVGKAWMQGYEEKILDVVKCLLAGGANVNATDSSGFTPLCLAVMCKNRNTQSLATVECLLSAGADVNAGFGRVSSTRVGSNGRIYTPSNPDQGGSALHIAIKTAFSKSKYPAPNFDIITRLIAAGANVNARDFNDKMTPLDIAFHKNCLRKPDVARLTDQTGEMQMRKRKIFASPAELLRFPDLVQFPDLVSSDIKDALVYSSRSENCCSRVELIKYLIAAGAKISNVLFFCSCRDSVAGNCSCWTRHVASYGVSELIDAQESKNRWVKEVLRFIEEEDDMINMLLDDAFK